MEAKKSLKADLESYKVIFSEIGFIIALSFILMALEWKTSDRSIQELNINRQYEAVEEIIPITEQKKILPPPVVHQPIRFNIVTNDKLVTEDIVIDAEANEETAIPEYIPIFENIEIEEEIVEEAPIFLVVESPPSFPGGVSALNKYLAENIAYPTMAKEANIQGIVFLTFVVDKTGGITDVRILRGLGGGCDEEAIRVVSEMPKWEPGKQRGVPVRVQFNLPVRFILY